MLRDLLFRLRALFGSNARERDLDDELRFHLEHQVALHMERGLNRAEAERRARIEFGGLEQIKEDTRDAHSISALETTVRDLRFALRLLRKSPGFTLVATLSLALGIGANAAIFQLLDAIRLRTLPVEAPHQLAQVVIPDMMRIARGAVNRDNSVTYGIWEQIRKRQQAFSGVFVWSDGEVNLSREGEVRMARALWISGEGFPVLGIRPALGRLFTPADDYRGCGIPGVVISHRFWQSEFAGDPTVIGRKLTLNGRPVAILGVTRASFVDLDVGRAFQVALPVCSITTLWFDALNEGTFWWLTAMGRLQPGWTIERADAQLNSISPGAFQASLPPRYPTVSAASYLGMKLTAIPAAAGISGLREQYSDPLWMLLGIAGLVLLIACANLANLMLARASARQREIAVRLAIGASRGRLIRQLMSESLLIAFAGAAAGLVFARNLSGVMVSLLGDAGDISIDLHLDWRVFAFTASLAVLTCVLFGLTPALRASGQGPGPVLKAMRGMTAGRESFRLRRLLLVSQVALSLVLLVGALLFVRSLQNLLHADTGFHPENVVIADLRFARAHPEKVRVDAFQRALLDRVRAVPGVVSAADATVVQLSGTSWGNKVWMDGGNSTHAPEAHFSRVSPEYFRTLSIPLLAGRDFEAHDTHGAPNVAIVNQTFAHRIANGANPIGRRFRVEATPATPEMVYEIVGLVADTKYLRLREPFGPLFYVPIAQDPSPSLSDQLLIRTSAPTGTLFPALRRAIAEADPEARFTFYAYRERIEGALRSERLMATLSTAFGILAALLSAIGLHGVMSYMVARRRNELGIRMALGADRRRIIALVMRESANVLAIGLAAGAALSIYAASFARKLLFGLTPYDPATLLTTALLLAAVAFAATWIPARRAASQDPTTALRDE